MLDGQHRDASALDGAAPEIHRRLSAKRAQLERVRRERANALAVGDRRRAAELGHRGARVKGEIEREQQVLNVARLRVREGERARRATGEPYTRERREEQDRFLDAQAALPASAQAQTAGERRDYAALSSLAGYGREEYQRLDPRGQRAARLEIDRELALRRELSDTATTLGAGGETTRLGRRERRRADGEFDEVLKRRMRDRGQSMPASRGKRSAFDAWRADGRADRPTASDRSSVMRDAHEVAARRKRQLGRDRP
jgi:hypothetical protein